MNAQGGGLFNRLSESFLRGDLQQAAAERQRIEALIQQRALSPSQFVQYNQLISQHERMQDALEEAEVTGDPQAALGILDDVLELEPRFLLALLGKALRLFMAATGTMGQGHTSQQLVLLDRAAAACRNAIKLHPTAPHAHFMYGAILLTRWQLSNEHIGHVDMDSLKQAAADTSEAIELFLDQGMPASQIAAAWTQLGKIHRLRGDVLDKLYGHRAHESGELEAGPIADQRDVAWEHAISDFNRAIELDGSNWEPYTECGETLLSVDRLSDSIPYLEEAVRIAPESVPARVGLIEGMDLAGPGHFGKDFYTTIMEHCLYVLDSNPADWRVRHILTSAFSAVLDDDPKNMQALRVLEGLLDRWLPVLSSEPTDESAHAQLRDVLPYILVQNPSHPKALEALNRLSESERQTVQERYTKAWQRANRPH